MFKDMTRSGLLQVWFAAVTLIVVAAIALGVSISLSTGALLLALCLAPPLILRMLWPGVPPQTIAEVIHDADVKK